MGFVARFFLLVIALSFGEFYLLFLVAQEISALTTILLCILTGVLGGSMVRAQGLQAWRAIQRAMARGELPTLEIVSGLILIGIGVMLLTPGFITDTVAFLLLIPPLRRQAAGWTMRYFKKRMQLRAVRFGGSSRTGEDSGVIIEVDPLDVKKNDGRLE